LKQLGNLAIVCAQRPEVLMQLYEHQVVLYLGQGSERETLQAPWDDDKKISNMIRELNFGKYAARKGAAI
jgi:hypothetical protein